MDCQMANARLPRHHYAAKWVADKELKTPEEVTFGLRLVSLPMAPTKKRSGWKFCLLPGVDVMPIGASGNHL